MATANKLNELTVFGFQYIRWGSRLFITGLCLQLVPLFHYARGSSDRPADADPPVSDEFLEEIVLWFGCPAEMAAQIVMFGGLILFVFGFCYSLISRYSSREVTAKERLALKLCVIGLVAETLSTALLYQIFESLQPNFYFQIIEPHRTIWVVAQLLSFLVYFVGTVLALGSIKGEVKPLLEGA